MNEFLTEHPIEELQSMSDAQLKALLEPYFPATRHAMLPTEKPRKIGVGTRAVLDAIDKNKDAIEALLKARGLKV